MKKRRTIPRLPPTIFSIPALLDQDFDNEDELILDEPPVMAVLGNMGRRLKPFRDEED